MFRTARAGPRSERDPDAAFVVTATFMIVAIMPVAAIPPLVEIPVIGMIVEPHAGDRDTRIGMPAIAFAVTGHAGGGCAGGADKRAGRHEHGDGGG